MFPSTTGGMVKNDSSRERKKFHNHGHYRKVCGNEEILKCDKIVMILEFIFSFRIISRSGTAIMNHRCNHLKPTSDLTGQHSVPKISVLFYVPGMLIPPFPHRKILITLLKTFSNLWYITFQKVQSQKQIHHPVCEAASI